MGWRPKGSRGDDDQQPRVRFKDAVPCRADRRELRRRLRAAARSQSGDTDRRLAGTLTDLAEQRASVASVSLQAQGVEEIVQFSDGTLLGFEVVEHTEVFDQMGGQLVLGMRLGQVIPCPGWRWYRLWFLLPHGEAAEVTAKVNPYPPPSAPPTKIPWWWGWPVP